MAPLAWHQHEMLFGYLGAIIGGFVAAPGDPQRVGAAFARMRELFDALRAGRPHFDTLSMGMSDDFELAIAMGATMVRIGTALFGQRPNKAEG
mgnify:CR=1 FL=1